MERNVIEQFVSIKMIEYRYHSCPDFNTSLNSSHSQYGKRKEEIEKAYIEWYDDILFYNERIPNDAEFLNEINSIKEILRFIDSNMDPDRFYKNGPDDTALCKIYLKRMKDKLWDEDIEDIKCLFFALQWLLRKQSEEYPISLTDENEAAETVEVEEDKDTVMLRQQIEKLGLLNEEGVGKEFYPLLYTLRDAWQIQNKTWAIDNTKFGKKVAPILGKKDSTIAKGLNRACEYLRKDKKSLECYPLSTLRAKEIGIHGEKYKMEELEKWQERLKKINTVMS